MMRNPRHRELEVLARSMLLQSVSITPHRLADRFPHHDFAHLPPQWWHEGVEAQEQTNARADAFRTLMAARDDDATTLLVSHWAFILALTGVSLANGEWLEYDPSGQFS